MIFKKLFKRFVKDVESPPEVIKSSNKTTISDIQQFDDIWIKINKAIFEGWVVSVKENLVSIVYSDENNKLQDASFKIERPLNRTIIEQNGKTLILNKDET